MTRRVPRRAPGRRAPACYARHDFWVARTMTVRHVYSGLDVPDTRHRLQMTRGNAVDITMDTERQKRLEELFRSKSSIIRQMLDELSAESRGSDSFWRSPDAQAFREQWVRIHAPALDQVSLALARAGDNLQVSREGLIRSQAH